MGLPPPLAGGPAPASFVSCPSSSATTQNPRNRSEIRSAPSPRYQVSGSQRSPTAAGRRRYHGCSGGGSGWTAENVLPRGEPGAVAQTHGVRDVKREQDGVTRWDVVALDALLPAGDTAKHHHCHRRRLGRVRHVPQPAGAAEPRPANRSGFFGDIQRALCQRDHRPPAGNEVALCPDRSRNLADVRGFRQRFGPIIARYSPSCHL